MKTGDRVVCVKAHSAGILKVDSIYKIIKQIPAEPYMW